MIEGVFVCSYSVLIFIFMRLNLSLADAISTSNARYDFFVFARVLIPCNFKF